MGFLLVIGCALKILRATDFEPLACDHRARKKCLRKLIHASPSHRIPVRMNRCVCEAQAAPRMAATDALFELLSRVARGEQAAMADLYDRTSRRAFGLSLRILREPESAEEAMLDAFTQVWQKAADYDPARGSVMGWILLLTRSRALDSLRARSRRPEEEPVEAASAVDPGLDPEQITEASERARNVRQALLALPKEQRQVIEAAFFEGLSHSEVSESLGQPLGTVKSRIRSGLSNLRDRLEGIQGVGR